MRASSGMSSRKAARIAAAVPFFVMGQCDDAGNVQQRVRLVAFAGLHVEAEATLENRQRLQVLFQLSRRSRSAAA